MEISCKHNTNPISPYNVDIVNVEVYSVVLEFVLTEKLHAAAGNEAVGVVRLKRCRQ